MKHLLLYLLLIPSFLFCQVSIDFGIEYSDTIPSRFKTSISDFRSSIYNLIPSYSKRDKYEKVSYKFSDYAAHSENSLLQSGNIYANWPELEDYLNQILQEVLPEKYKSNTNFHIYINKSGVPNAFASPAGNIYVNIGLISDVNTEAKLASVIAHEVAHLVSQHSFLHFIKNEFGDFGNGMVRRNWTSFRHSKGQELEADSLAFVWMKDSKYKTSELFNMFKMQQFREEKSYRRSFNKWYKKEKLIPHATSTERLTAFGRFTQYDKTDDGSYFVINQNYFNAARQVAKYETLKLLKQNENYYACLEQAFRFHLFNPDNHTYIYYIMESIRELGVIEPEIWDNNFLTYGHYDTLRIENRVKKIPITKSIFKEIDIGLVPIYDYELDSIKAKFYWEDEVKFKTYNEAIEFYNSLGKALKCNECLLSYGESLVDTKLKERYIRGYINSLTVSGNIDKYLLEKVPNDSIFTKKIVFIDDFICFTKQGMEFVYLTKDSINIAKKIRDSLQIHFPEKEVYLLSDIKNRSLKEYNNLMRLIYFVQIKQIKTVTKSLFAKYEAKEIEYVQCEFYESKNSNKSLGLYKNIVKTDYDEMLKRTKSTRNLNVWVYGVSIKNKNELQYNYYNWVDNKIKFKESGYENLIKKVISGFLPKY